MQCEGAENMTIVISEDVSLLYIKVRRTNIADSEWYYCGIPVPGGNWKNLSKHVAMAALRERWRRPVMYSVEEATSATPLLSCCLDSGPSRVI